MGLRHVFGDKPIPRLFDFLRVHRRWDYPLSTIAKATGLSYRTLQAIIPALVEKGLMKETRMVAKAKFYSLDFESKAIKKLDEFAVLSDLEAAPTKQKAVVLAQSRSRR